MTSSSCFVFLFSFFDFLMTPLKEVIHHKKINSDMKKYWYLVKKTNCCLHKQRPLWRWTNKEKASPTPGSWLASVEHCSKLSLTLEYSNVEVVLKDESALSAHKDCVKVCRLPNLTPTLQLLNSTNLFTTRWLLWWFFSSILDLDSIVPFLKSCQSLYAVGLLYKANPSSLYVHMPLFFQIIFFNREILA